MRRSRESAARQASSSSLTPRDIFVMRQWGGAWPLALLRFLPMLLGGKGKKGRGGVMGMLSSILGGGGDDDDDEGHHRRRSAQAAANRHQQMMTMLTMGAQRRGVGSRNMMRELVRSARRAGRLEGRLRTQRRHRRRRRRRLMLRNEPNLYMGARSTRGRMPLQDPPWLRRRRRRRRLPANHVYRLDGPPYF